MKGNAGDTYFTVEQIGTVHVEEPLIVVHPHLYRTK